MTYVFVKGKHSCGRRNLRLCYLSRRISPSKTSIAKRVFEENSCPNDVPKGRLSFDEIIRLSAIGIMCRTLRTYPWSARQPVFAPQRPQHNSSASCSFIGLSPSQSITIGISLPQPRIHTSIFSSYNYFSSMGKKSKKGVNQRARKRANEAAALLQERQAEEIATKSVEAKADADLFVVDTVGDASALTHVPKRQRTGEKVKRDKNALSEKDKRQVKRILQTQGEEGAVAMAQEGRERLARRRGAKRVAGRARTDFDLWGNDDGDAGNQQKKKLAVAVSGGAARGGTAPVQVVVKKNINQVTKLSKEVGAAMPEMTHISNKQIKAREARKQMARPAVAVEVAHAGQSYRPDPEAHQDVIGEALAIEIRRNDAIEYKETPISQGLSEETKALLVGSDDESSSDEEDDDSGDESGKVSLHKKKEKLTRAQRNKQRRVRAERNALEKRRAEKRMLASLSEHKKTAKQIAKEEAEKAERREELRRLKAERQIEPLGRGVTTKLSTIDPIRAPALPVALTEELAEQGGGALRTVRPKGSLLTDRMESLVDRKMAARKTLTKKNVVQGRKRKMKGGKHREYLLI